MAHRRGRRIAAGFSYLLLLLAGFALVLALAPPAQEQLASTPWPIFHHDLRRTGLSPYDTSSNPGTQRWKFTAGNSVYSSPAIGVDGTIYVGSGDSNLYAINSDGTQKWKFTTGNEVLSSPAIGAEGTIYVGSADKHLYAVNPGGTQKWKFATGARVISSPAVGSDGTIYVGSNDLNVYAVNPNGTRKWKFATQGDVLCFSPAIGADGTLYIGSDGNSLYAVNPDGSTKWLFTTGGSVSRLTSWPNYFLTLAFLARASAICIVGSAGAE